MQSTSVNISDCSRVILVLLVFGIGASNECSVDARSFENRNEDNCVYHLIAYD
jgi:hypothetical protein